MRRLHPRECYYDVRCAGIRVMIIRAPAPMIAVARAKFILNASNELRDWQELSQPMIATLMDNQLIPARYRRAKC